IFEESLIDSLLDTDAGQSMVLVSKYKSWMDGTVIELDDNYEIKNFVGKKDFKYADVDKYYKTVNIYKFTKSFVTKSYLPFLQAYITYMGKNDYYEQVLSVINFVNKTGLKACVISDDALWYEIDDKQDYDIASALFAESDQLEKFQSRYGGYWRFPTVKDFCYLVNPYFPNENLKNEIKHNFDTLISEYPSGLNVQNLLISKMFGVNQKYVVTGNGAAELINALMNSFEGIVGITAPTFNEYPERVHPDKIRYMNVSYPDYNYGINELKKFCSEIDMLILINPDNPSGNFINKNDLIELITFCKNNQKLIVVDESFVDFSQEGEKNSIICDEIVSQYGNLVIVKSISKSYGVPGIRLGTAVTSNKDILDKIKSYISIWNINSFGEYFLQIIGKYKSNYTDACSKIAAERDRFFEELKKITFLRPLPSQANYFLCEVTGKCTSTELTRMLLKKNSILIKDLYGKRGFKEKQFIRIAVRNKEDNDFLLKAMMEF
ncbi:MAG TPA: aminotransferase class I/II-fold pyridoxal phosphate-dependent enzyme, partial [Spirochaetota bacterium]|nr:aminotransferase class I/II-fold pyridoxal phosphate-dependent enzyme [Spirochaetota bacterium]